MEKLLDLQAIRKILVIKLSLTILISVWMLVKLLADWSIRCRKINYD